MTNPPIRAISPAFPRAPAPRPVGHNRAIPRNFILVGGRGIALLLPLLSLSLSRLQRLSPVTARAACHQRLLSPCLSLSLSLSLLPRFYQVVVIRRPRSRGRTVAGRGGGGEGYSLFFSPALRPNRFSRASRRNIARQLCRTRPDCDISSSSSSSSSSSCPLWHSSIFVLVSKPRRTQPLPFFFIAHAGDLFG